MAGTVQKAVTSASTMVYTVPVLREDDNRVSKKFDTTKIYEEMAYSKCSRIMLA
jgi:hypothetical protein